MVVEEEEEEKETEYGGSDSGYRSHLELEWSELRPSRMRGGWRPRRKHAAVSHAGYLYLMGGFAPAEEEDEEEEDDENPGKSSAFEGKAEERFEGGGAHQQNLNDVWRTEDGTHWECVMGAAQWSGRDGHSVISVGGDMLLLGGTSDPMSNENDVWRSENGREWQLVCPSAGWVGRWQHASVSHGSQGVFVLGGWSSKGHLNDVWCSQDAGHSWSCVTSHASWSPRMFHAVLSLGGYMYLMGGMEGATGRGLNDVWRSKDGKDWELVVMHAEWCARAGHASDVWNGCLLVCGGGSGAESTRRGGELYNDIWVSSDEGRTWKETTELKSWLPRKGHAAVVHDSRLFIMGGVHAYGERGKIQYLNDCYCGEYARTDIEGDDSLKSKPQFLRERQKSLESMYSTSSFFSASFHEGMDEEELAVAAASGGTRAEPLLSVPGMDLISKVRNIAHQFHDLRRLRTELEEYRRQGDLLLQTFRLAMNTTGPNDFLTLSLEQEQEQQNSTGSATQKEARGLLPLSPVPSVEVLSCLEELAGLKERLLCTLNRIRLSVCIASGTAALNVEELLQERAEIASLLVPATGSVKSSMRDISSKMVCWETMLADAIDLFENARVRFGQQEEEMLSCGVSEKLNYISSEEIFEDLARQLWHLDPPPSPSGTSSNSAWERLGESLADLGNLCLCMAGLFEGGDAAAASVDDTLSLERVNATVDNFERGLRSFDEENERLRVAHRESLDLISDLLTLGRRSLVEALTSCNAIKTDLTLRLSEAEKWGNVAVQLADPSRLEALKRDIEQQVREARSAVLDQQDRLDDCKSTLLKRKRRNADSSELESLSADLSAARRGLREARSFLRALEADVATKMHRLVPELALSIPGILSPSGLGSLPHRILTDYEDVVPLSTVPHTSPYKEGVDKSSASSNQSVAASPGEQANAIGSARVFRAKFEGEHVVLKGYALVSEARRENLERELAILTRLRHDAIIAAQALVHDAESSGPILTLYIEFPYCDGGNLWHWLHEKQREVWELQRAFRQIVCGVLHLHENGIVHKDIKPSNVLVHSDGRMILADFDIAKDLSDGGTETSGCLSSYSSGGGGGFATIRAGTSGFMAPEIENGGSSSPFSDMFSLGCVLHSMHFPNHPSGPIAGMSVDFASSEKPSPELADLLTSLLAVDPLCRLSASGVLLHPYVNKCHIQTLVEEGTIMEQGKKLEAVRELFCKLREEERQLQLQSGSRSLHWKVSREPTLLVPAVLESLDSMIGSNIRRPLRVSFEGEAGVDEGGLLGDLFNIFFEAILHPSYELFEAAPGGGAESTALVGHSETSERASSSPATSSQYFLPCARKVYSGAQLKNYSLVGRAIVKCLLEGRRIGSYLAPSLFKFISGIPPGLSDVAAWDPQLATSLQWLLANSGAAQLFLHFDDLRSWSQQASSSPSQRGILRQESGGASSRDERRSGGLITDTNKRDYVTGKIQRVLISSRQPALEALHEGIWDGIRGLSPYAPPILELLNHSDWRLLLCGADNVSGPQVVGLLRWQGFSPESELPTWLRSLILSFDQDMLRRFLMFVCGFPSLPAASINDLEITVRCQRESVALPIAHTCFHQLDIPEYKSESQLQDKLIRAMFEPSFGIV